MIRRAQVTTQPQAHTDLLLGINQVADLLAPTIGPMGGHVAGSANDNQRIEMWDDAGTTVRRLMELGTPQLDIGAMMMRTMIYRLEQRVGDGGSTAALLTREIVRRGVRLMAAGINAMDVAKGLRAAREAAIHAIRAQAIPAKDEEMLSRVALAACGDEPLSALLGEISSLVGAEGYVSIDKFVAPYLERRYVNGAHFASRIASMHFYTDTAHRSTTLSSPAVAVVDEALTEPMTAVALMEAAVAKGAKSLLILAQEISGAALNLLVMNNSQPAEKRKLTLLGAKLNASGAERTALLRDICVLTGASLVGKFQATGADKVTSTHLGSAIRVEWEHNGLSIVSDPANAIELRHEAERVRERLAQLAYDEEERKILERRLGVLTGGIAELKIGAHSMFARDALFGTATRTLRLLSAAQRGGVVAGAGAAFVHVSDALAREQMTSHHLSEDAFTGVKLLADALGAPLAQIAKNAGHDHPASVVHHVKEAGSPMTWDAFTHRLVNGIEAGLLDAAEVTVAVLDNAVSLALMALTTDTIVYHRKPKEQVKI